jgi:hypothetical protein
MTYLMSSDFLTFFGHMLLWKDFLFGSSDILFGTERSLKLLVMKQWMKSVVMTNTCNKYSEMGNLISWPLVMALP